MWMSLIIQLDVVDHPQGWLVGTSQADKARSNDRILDAAAELLRRHGLSGVRVTEVMRAAGLTHGGFYKHFQDRQQLIVEALRRALTPAQQAGPYRSYTDFVRGYLGWTHRELRGRGCPMAALAGDVVRADDQVRSVFTGGVRDAVAQVARLLGDLDHHDGAHRDGDLRARAAAAFSTAVGALVLARAVDDAELADFILASARTALLPPEQER
jgi:TetR/AcrR family transcriptional regulator, transcriptional repressor for nem operon